MIEEMVWFKRFLRTDQMLKYSVKQCAVEFLPVLECTGAITGAPTSSMNSSYSRMYTTHLNTTPELPLQSQLWSR